MGGDRIREGDLVHLVDEEDTWSASVLVARLRAEGLRAVVAGARRSVADRIGPTPGVWVHPDDVEQARTVLVEIRVREAFPDDGPVPEGDVGNSPYPDETGRPPVAALLVAVVVALIVFAVAIVAFSLVP